jgi:hypothetical protein
MLDANGQAFVYLYAQERRAIRLTWCVLTFDEGRRIAVNVAKLPGVAHLSSDGSDGTSDLT